MDVNNVAFGDFSIGAKNTGAKQKEKNDASNVDVKSNLSSLNVNPDVVYDALDNVAMQNIAMTVNSGTKEVNPEKHLSPERIANIKAMMGKFVNGAGVVEDVLENELPFLAPDVKKALAAKIFAQE